MQANALWKLSAQTSLKYLNSNTHEPCHDIGRAALPRCLSIGPAQQRSPTKKGFKSTRRVNSRMETTSKPGQSCAAFMPLQRDIYEGIPIVPMILDMPILKRNKFRDPRFMVTKHATSRKGSTPEPRHKNWRTEIFTLNFYPPPLWLES